MSENIHGITFTLKSEEMKNAFNVLSKEQRVLADACTHYIEEALSHSDENNVTRVDLVEAACKVLGEEFYLDNLPNTKMFIKYIKPRRDDFQQKADNYAWFAEHVVPDAVYRLSHEDAQKLGLISWPERRYGSLCSSRYNKALDASPAGESMSEQSKP